MTSKIFSVSVLGLVAADTAAALVGGVVDIDADEILSADFAFTAPIVRFSGGVITLGNYDLTGASQSVQAPACQLFTVNGTGRVLGSFRIDAWRPEHYSGIGGDNTSSGAKSNASQTGTAVNLILRHLEQSSFPGAPLRMSGYYATDQEHIFYNLYQSGDFPTLLGDGVGASRFYRTDDDNHIWGVATDNGSVGFPKPMTQDIALFGDDKTQGVALVENRGAVLLYPYRTAFNECLEGFRCHNYYEGTYAEYSRPRDCQFKDCVSPQTFKVTNGTASFHGCGADRTYWARTTTDAYRYADFASNTFPYNTHWDVSIWNIGTNQPAYLLRTANISVPISLSGNIKVENDENSPFYLMDSEGTAYHAPVNVHGGPTTFNGFVFADYYSLHSGTQHHQFTRVPQRSIVPVSGNNDIPELFIGDNREIWVEIWKSGSIMYMARLTAFKRDSGNGGSVHVDFETAFLGTPPTWSSPYNDGTVRVSSAAFDSSTRIYFTSILPGVISA